jgi:hypothetical protein
MDDRARDQPAEQAEQRREQGAHHARERRRRERERARLREGLLEARGGLGVLLERLLVPGHAREAANQHLAGRLRVRLGEALAEVTDQGGHAHKQADQQHQDEAAAHAGRVIALGTVGAGVEQQPAEGETNEGWLGFHRGSYDGGISGAILP